MPANTVPTKAELTADLHRLLMTEIRPVQYAPDIIRLIQQGADVNARDSQNLPPLLRCLGWAYDGSTPTQDRIDAHKIIGALLSAGADMTARTPQDQSAADLAALWDDSEWSAQMLECETYRRSDPVLAKKVAQVRVYWPKPDTPVTEQIKSDFLSACRDALDDEVTYYLHIYPDAANWTATFSSTTDMVSHPLIMAAQAGNRADTVLALLLQAGGRVNWRDRNGNTALHYAITTNNSTRIIRLLVAAGADENAVNAMQRTPLSTAKSPQFTQALAALQESVAARGDLAAIHQKKDDALQHHLAQGAIGGGRKRLKL